MTGPAAGGWQRILEIGQGSWLGMSGQGDLWVGSFDRPTRQVDVMNPVGLLPLLERPYSVVQSEIAEARASGNLDPTLMARTLAAPILVKTAMRSGSDYWASRALLWASDMDQPDVLLPDVRDVLNAPWASQATRHKARRLIKRWATAETGPER